MRNKSIMILFVFMAFIFIFDPLFAQEKTDMDQRMRTQPPPRSSEPNEDYTEEQALNYIDKTQTTAERNVVTLALCSQMYSFAEFALKINSEKIVQRILDIPEFEAYNEKNPQYAYDVTEAKIRALRILKNFAGIKEYVKQSLDHPSPRVQIAAASTLLSWGEEWELAAPIICNHGAYIEFQQNKDERAVPLLENAVINGSWKGRLYAAAALYYTYGDSAKYPEVALDIILNTPANTADEDIIWAKHHALRLVPKFNLESSLPGLCRLAYDDDFVTSSMAVGHLVHLSSIGYQEATQTLIDVKNNHPDAGVREQAKKGLSEQE